MNSDSTNSFKLAFSAVQTDAGKGAALAKPISISYIIPALNEEQFIGDCIDSIKRQILPERINCEEIIVVDNQSTDRTVKIGKSKGATVISHAPGNPSQSRNEGAKFARGEWLVFVDADCVLDRYWTARCAEELIVPSTVAAGGPIGVPQNSSSWVQRTTGELFGQSNINRQTVRWLPSAGMVVKQHAFSEVDGFNESLLTCEDCDLGYRLSEHGNLVFAPNARLVHLGESKSVGQLFFREAWRTRGNFRLALTRPWDLRNWFSLIVPVAYVLILAGLCFAILGWQNMNGSMTKALALLALSLVIPPVLALRRTGRFSGFHSLFRQSVVIATFLVARCLGLFWQFKRLDR